MATTATTGVAEKSDVKAGELRRKARELAVSAWSAQPVKQRDGTFLDLCFRGRIHRAIGMLAKARTDGDAKLVAQLEAGLGALEAKATEASSAAEQALSDYAAECARLGRTPEDLYPYDCTCAGCKESGAMHRIGSTEGNLRKSVWEFIGPNVWGEEPEVLALIRIVRAEPDSERGKKARDRVWNHLVRLATSVDEYLEANRETGNVPDWSSVFNGLGR